MNKEEILKRAQNANSDERETWVKDKSLLWSYVTMVTLAAVFSFLRAEQGLPTMDLCATVCASVCAAMAYRGLKTKRRDYLILALLPFVLALVATLRFFQGH